MPIQYIFLLRLDFNFSFSFLRIQEGLNNNYTIGIILKSKIIGSCMPKCGIRVNNLIRLEVPSRGCEEWQFLPIFPSLAWTNLIFDPQLWTVMRREAIISFFVRDTRIHINATRIYNNISHILDREVWVRIFLPSKTREQNVKASPFWKCGL